MDFTVGLELPRLLARRGIPCIDKRITATRDDEIASEPCGAFKEVLLLVVPHLLARGEIEARELPVLRADIDLAALDHRRGDDAFLLGLLPDLGVPKQRQRKHELRR